MQVLDDRLLLLGSRLGTRPAEQGKRIVWLPQQLFPVPQGSRLDAQTLGCLFQTKAVVVQTVGKLQDALPHLTLQAAPLRWRAAAGLLLLRVGPHNLHVFVRC